MSQYEAKDKGKGESIVKGSLGALLASYGNSSSSELSEDEELDKDNRCTTNAKTVAHKVPNPLFNTEQGPTIVENPHYQGGIGEAPTLVVKQEREDEPNKSELMTNDNGPMVGIKIKEEPKEESISCDNVVPPTATDFATLNDKSKEGVDMELSVEDFLPSNESYNEARVVKVESGTSDSESDSENSETDESEERESIIGEENDPEKQGAGKKKVEGPKAKGEMSLYDLPPIEDLHISVPHDECKPIGLIKSVVEPLVIVEAHLETPALDLDSVLFLEEGDRALGRIFDVIGPVKQPMYCVRFNSKEHIEKNKVQVGMPVYCAPKTPYTTYVFLAQLRKLKGSDASWLNDIEPPVEEVEYSDDEMERFAKKEKRNRKILKARATEDDATYKEDDGTSNVPNTRGQKRHFNRNEQHYAFTSTTYGPNGPVMSTNPNGCPPFIPPMIPGFTPFGPTSTYPGYPTPAEGWHQPPNYMNQQRGFPRPRGRGFQRFRPPLQPAYPSEFQQNPYRQIQDTSHWGSWRPPPQWQNQNSGNFNFGGGGQSSYSQTFGMMQPRTLQPPPPPPPPPGH